MKATCPWQWLSVDFAFFGQSRKDKNEYEDYLGLHGETCWILFKDHFTGLVVGKCLVSKATPLIFIRDLLQKHFPGVGNTTNRPTSPLSDNCIHQLYESFIGTEGGGSVSYTHLTLPTNLRV